MILLCVIERISSHTSSRYRVVTGVCPHTLSLSLPSHSQYVVWASGALLLCIATLMASGCVQLMKGTISQKEGEERNSGCFSQPLSFVAFLDAVFIENHLLSSLCSSLCFQLLINRYDNYTLSFFPSGKDWKKHLHIWG